MRRATRHQGMNDPTEDSGATFGSNGSRVLESMSVLRLEETELRFFVVEGLQGRKT